MSECWSSCFFHAKLKLYLVVYIDDFKLAGPAENMEKGWELIRRDIQMEDPHPMQLYLGCLHKRFEGYVEGVGPVIGVEYDMESFLASCIQRYLKPCRSSSAAKCTRNAHKMKAKTTKHDIDNFDFE